MSETYFGQIRAGKLGALQSLVSAAITLLNDSRRPGYFSVLMPAEFLEDLVILASSANKAELLTFIGKHKGQTL